MFASFAQDSYMLNNMSGWDIMALGVVATLGVFAYWLGHNGRGD